MKPSADSGSEYGSDPSVYNLRMSTVGAILLGVLLVVRSADSRDSQDIVTRLMSTSGSSEVQLNGISRAKAIETLSLAQKSATGRRSQEIAFLLVSLGVEYKQNRDFLLSILKQCGSSESPCDEDSVQLVIRLYQTNTESCFSH